MQNDPGQHRGDVGLLGLLLHSHAAVNDLGEGDSNVTAGPAPPTQGESSGLFCWGNTGAAAPHQVVRQRVTEPDGRAMPDSEEPALTSLPCHVQLLLGAGPGATQGDRGEQGTEGLAAQGERARDEPHESHGSARLLQWKD